MGQKVNPIGLRLGINRTWDSRWFADGADYGRLLHEDIKVRGALKKRLYQAGV
jgi:small subunit ribosomal protein S3